MKADRVFLYCFAILCVITIAFVLGAATGLIQFQIDIIPTAK